jgi:hypothetical protein
VPFKPWTVAALAVLADGDWHAREHVLRAGMAAVPPGVAFRDGEKDRNRVNRRMSGPGARTRGTDETSIQVGARSIVRDCINSLLVSKHGNPPRLERAIVDGVDSLRLARTQRQRAS